MAGLSNYLANKLIDHINGKTSYTMPANVYVALCSTVPTDATAGTEITTGQYTGYARSAAIAGSMAAAAAGSSTNSGGVVSFPPCTGGTGTTAVGFQCYDAATGGNPMQWGTCSLAISNGITPSFAASQLTVTMA